MLLVGALFHFSNWHPALHRRVELDRIPVPHSSRLCRILTSLRTWFPRGKQMAEPTPRALVSLQGKGSPLRFPAGSRRFLSTPHFLRPEVSFPAPRGATPARSGRPSAGSPPTPSRPPASSHPPPRLPAPLLSWSLRMLFSFFNSLSACPSPVTDTIGTSSVTGEIGYR